MTRAAAGLPLSQWGRVEALWRAIASGSRKQWFKYPDLHQAFWFPHRVKGSTHSSGFTRRGRTLPELMQQMRSESGEAPPATTAASHGAAHHEGQDVEAGDATPHTQGGASRAQALDQRDFADWTPQGMDRFRPLVGAFQRPLPAKLF